MLPRPSQRVSAVKTVSFASGGTVSSAISIEHFVTAHVLTTLEFNTDTITLQGCDTVDGTFYDIKNAGGTTLTITGATNTWIELPATGLGVPFLKLKTGTATSAAATLTIVLKS